VCGKSGVPLVCHEQWGYDDKNHVATLSGFEIHCERCDLVTHMGLSIKCGKGAAAIAQYCAINNCTEAEVRATSDDAFDTWQQRNMHTWTIEVDSELLRRHPQLCLLMKAHPAQTNLFGQDVEEDE
jgi:hypothetical protein